MRTVLIIMSTLFVIVNLTNAWTVNFGLQENLPIMGILGMVVSALSILLPIAAVALVTYGKGHDAVWNSMLAPIPEEVDQRVLDMIRNPK